MSATTTGSQIKQALVTAIQAGTDLRGKPYVPGTIDPPALVIVPGTFIPGDARSALEYNTTFASGSNKWIFTVVVVVSMADLRVAQDKTDQYIAPGGTNSIKAAIEADPGNVLSSVVDWIVVKECIQYGYMVWNGVNMFGAQIVVEAFTNGS